MPIFAQFKDRRIWITVLTALSIAAFGLMMASTRDGAEVTDDSILYVAAARNILAGNGFSWLSGGGEVKPITGFPPAYSVAIAAAGLTGTDLFEGARWVNAFLFGASAFLVGLLILQATNSGPAALIGASLVVSNADMLLVYRWIMGEALFVTLLLISIAFLAAYLNSPRWSLALLSGLAVALAMLTRYPGVGLLPASVLAVWLLSRAGWRGKLREGLLLAAVAALPFAILTLINYFATGSPYHTNSLLEVPQYATLVSYLNKSFSWFMPFAPDESIRLRWKVLILILVLLIAPLVLYVKGLRSWSGEPRGSIPKSAAVPLVASFLSLAYMAILVSAGGDVGGAHLQRYMAPVYVSWVVVTATVIYQVAWNGRGALAAKVGAVVLAAFFLGWYGNEGYHFLQNPSPGILAGDYRRDNPGTVRALQQLDPSEPLYSNEIYRVYYLTNRSAYQVPMLHDLANDQSLQGSESKFHEFRRLMTEGAYLILFDSIDYQQDMFPSREVLTEGLVLLQKIGRGAVYVDPDAHPVVP